VPGFFLVDDIRYIFNGAFTGLGNQFSEGA
jgi:hypothetical protein